MDVDMDCDADIMVLLYSFLQVNSSDGLAAWVC